MRLKRALRRFTMIGLFIPLVFGTGCSVRPQRSVLGENRAQLGTIGVSAGSFVPEIQVPNTGGKGKAATIGAAKGLGMGLLAATGCLLTMGAIPQACLIGIGTPVVMVQQARAESKKWMPGTVEVEAEAMPSGVVANKNLQGSLREHVARAVTDRADRRVVTLEEKGPETLDEKISYHHLASRGIDAVLEVTIMKIGIVTSAYREAEADETIDTTDETIEAKNGDPVDRSYSFTMAARARLIRVSEHEVLGSATYSLKSKALTWSKWSVAGNCTGDSAECLSKEGVVAETLEVGHRTRTEQIVFSSKAS